MIDKKYYELDMIAYYRDYFIAFGGFIITFIACLHTTGWLFVFSFLMCCSSIHRAGVFVHEVTHQQRNEKFQFFIKLWDLTAGAAILMPSVRFVGPHLAHHLSGIFATKADPQYMLLRSSKALAVFILLVIPFIAPIYNLLLVIISSIGIIDIEGMIDRYLEKSGLQMDDATLDEAAKQRITHLGRYYLLLLIIFLWLLPGAIPLFYAVLVGGWAFSIWRIPLEHSLVEYKESSDKIDQIRDSYTIETQLAFIFQPMGLQFHTAHHMYPGVPYHNLRALHEELKQTAGPLYRQKVISLWSAIRGPATAKSTLD